MFISKKSFVFALGIFILPFVSAQAYIDVGSFFASFFEGISSGFVDGISYLFGDREIATRALSTGLIYMLLYSVVKGLFKKNWISTSIISGIITALSVIAIPSGFFEIIRTQYGVLGTVMLSMVPFAIVLFFTSRIESVARARMLWVFYCLYYFAFVIYLIFSEEKGWLSLDTLAYWVALIGGIIMFFFIGAIRGLLFKGDIEAIREEGRRTAQRSRALHDIQEEELESYTEQ